MQVQARPSVFFDFMKDWIQGKSLGGHDFPHPSPPSSKCRLQIPYFYNFLEKQHKDFSEDPHYEL